MIWNPVAGVGGRMGFYPGKKYVDLVGNDMYGEGADFSRAANEQLYAFARAQKKRYSSPSGACRSTSPSSCATSATSSRRSPRSSSRPTSTASPARSGPRPEAEQQADLPVLPHAARAGRLGRRDRFEAETALDGAPSGARR